MKALDQIAGNPFVGGQPVMHDAPAPPVPWYRQVGARYGPTEFTMDAIAKLIGVPVSNIMSGRLHDAAAAPRDAVPLSDDPREAQAVAGQNRNNAAAALGHGMEAGGLAALGSVGAKAPAGALRSGAARPEGMDMSQSARMQRAREMGFDTGQTWYHGTGENFASFKPSQSNEALGPGVYVSDQPHVANAYAEVRGAPEYQPGHVLPLYSRGSKFFQYDGDNLPRSLRAAQDILPSGLKNPAPYHLGDNPELFAQALKDAGYDGIYNKWTEGDRLHTQLNIFDPSNIRSVNAAFDPAKASSANLLAANPFAASLPLTYPED